MKNIGCADVILIILVIGLIFFSNVDINKNPNKTILGKSSHKNKLFEKDYINKYCSGETEYILPDKTRIDCLTDEYAIEFEYARKWAESIGQSLYYAKKTGKKPAVAIILRKESDKKYVEHIKDVDLGITIFEICSADYDGEDKSECIKDNPSEERKFDYKNEDNSKCFDRQPPYINQSDQSNN